MEEQKKNRIAAAVTVNVILLIAILAVVVIYQLVEIVSLNAQRKKIAEEIARYEKLLEDKQNDLDFLKSEEYEQYLLDLAFSLGYRFPDNQ